MSIRLVVLLAAALLGACSSSSQQRPEEESHPPGAESNPVTRARLEARVQNIKYQTGTTLISNLERIAAYGEQAIPVVIEGLKDADPMTRMGCSYVLGRIGNTKTVPHLVPMLQDEVAFVRYEAAAALGAMGSRAGYPVLVSGLSDERIQYRFKCIEALQDFTGQNFGYQHNAAPEARAVAVQQWESWLARVRSEEM